SLIDAFNPTSSLEEIKREFGYGIVTYLSFYLLSRDRGGLKTWMLGIFATALWLGLYTLYMGLTKGKLRFDGWHGGTLSYSVFVATVFPLLIASLLYPNVKWNWRVAVCFLLPVLMFTAQMTRNRMVWVAIVACTILIACLYLVRRPNRRAAIIMVVGGIVVLLAAGTMFTVTAKQKVKSEADFSETLKSTLANDPRFNIWSYSVQR